MALVVFLRGVNVGGHRTFRPSALAAQMQAFGVVNVGAAGTFIARRPTSRAELRAEFLQRLPFKPQVLICDAREVLRIASSDPFADEPPRPDIVRFVGVLSRRPSALPSMPILIPSTGPWGVSILSRQGSFLLGLYRREMKAIGYLSQIDTLVGAPVTIRNWNTISAIVQALMRR